MPKVLVEFCTILQASRGRVTFLEGQVGNHPCVNLVIFDCLEDEPVPRLGDDIPMWNQMGNKDKWYDNVFEFLRLYPQFDNTMILIMPIITTMKLVPHMRKFGMRVEYDFLCNEPHLLIHPHYKNKLVSIVIAVHSPFVELGVFRSSLSILHLVPSVSVYRPPYFP